MSKVNKYVVANELRNELLELLRSRKVNSRAIGQLVLERAPRSLMRWSQYLTLEELDKYLVPADDVIEGQLDISDFGIQKGELV